MSEVSDHDADAKWERIVRHAITRPEFFQAWKAVGEAGIASEDAVERAFGLIQDSEFHIERLGHTVYDIMHGVADWSEAMDVAEDMSDERAMATATGVLMSKILQMLMTQAAIFLIVGALVGVGSSAGVDSEAEGFPVPS